MAVACTRYFRAGTTLPPSAAAFGHRMANTLHFSEHQGWRQQYLDRARPDPSWWRKVSREPVQLTTGPLQFSNPLPSRDGKKLFVVGIQPRAELVRYDAKSGDFVPYLGGISASDVDFSRDGQWVTYVSLPEGTLWRSKLDGSAPAPTHLPSHADRLSPLVSRRPADCLRRRQRPASRGSYI